MRKILRSISNTKHRFAYGVGALLFALITTYAPLAGAQSGTGEDRGQRFDGLMFPYYDPSGGSCTVNPTSIGTQFAVDYDPLSLTYPDFPNEAEIVEGIRRTIQETYSSSPWLGLEQMIIDESKNANVNPLFIVASGGVESRFGDSKWGRLNNNYFGIDQGKRSFPSPEEGIRFFIYEVPRMLSGEGAGGRYANVKNIYEYSSVHQTGSIVYPGQPFDPMDVDSKPGITQDLYDSVMNVWVSWTITDHPNDKYDGNLYNPLSYYRLNIHFINKITRLNLPEDPSFATTVGCGSAGVAGANGWDLPGEGPNPMVYYSQLRQASAPSDPAVQGYYGDAPYGSGTIARCGCGPTSWAMIVSTLTGNPVEPPEVAAWAHQNGYRSGPDTCSGSAWWWVGGSAAASEARWGVRARQITITEAKGVLQSGGLIMTSVGPGNPFLSRGGNGHLLVMRGYIENGPGSEDDQFLFADPSDGKSKRQNGGDGGPADLFRELGSSRTPVDAATLSNGLKGLFAVEVSQPTGGQ